jgi:hypothetical protein
MNERIRKEVALMDDREHTGTRKSFLRRALGVGAGAIGFGALGGTAAAASNGVSTSSPTLTLYGHGFHAHVEGRRFGQLPQAGERTSVYGALHDRPSGRKVGDFHASATEFHAAGDALGSRQEHQTLALADGTIYGVGLVTGDEGTFAIIGGTGRYAGARGSYVARHEAHGLAGAGTAEFTITLTT